MERHGQEEDPVHHHGRTRPGRRPVREGNEDRQRDLPGTHLGDVRAEPAVHPAPDLFRHRGAEGFVELRVVALEFESLGESLHAAARDEHPAAPAAPEDRDPRELEVDGTQRLAAPRTGKAPGLAPGEPQGGTLLLLRRRGGIRDSASASSSAGSRPCVSSRISPGSNQAAPQVRHRSTSTSPDATAPIDGILQYGQFIGERGPAAAPRRLRG